ncbi:MAG TPA: hypothetical protein VIJ59_02895 [Caulobacteraceae bacterium]
MSEPSPRKPVLGSKFFAVVLMAIGAMIFGLCGLCTFNVFNVPEFVSGYYPGLTLGIFFAALFGGIPMAIGAVIFVVGFRRYRRS